MARNLRKLRQFLQGGQVADQGFITTGASAVTLDQIGADAVETALFQQSGIVHRGAAPYEHIVASGGTAGNEILLLPLRGRFIGQRCLVTFGREGNAADVVRINATATGVLVIEAYAFAGVTGFTQTTITNVDLDTPGEYALFEFVGQATPAWHLIYTTGVAA